MLFCVFFHSDNNNSNWKQKKSYNNNLNINNDRNNQLLNLLLDKLTIDPPSTEIKNDDLVDLSSCKKYNYLEANGVVVDKNDVLRGVVFGVTLIVTIIV